MPPDSLTWSSTRSVLLQSRKLYVVFHRQPAGATPLLADITVNPAVEPR